MRKPYPNARDDYASLFFDSACLSFSHFLLIADFISHSHPMLYFNTWINRGSYDCVTSELLHEIFCSYVLTLCHVHYGNKLILKFYCKILKLMESVTLLYLTLKIIIFSFGKNYSIKCVFWCYKMWYWGWICDFPNVTNSHFLNQYFVLLYLVALAFAKYIYNHKRRIIVIFPCSLYNVLPLRVVSFSWCYQSLGIASFVSYEWIVFTWYLYSIYR